MERFEEGDREDVIAPTDSMETPPAESEEPSSGDEVPE